MFRKNDVIGWLNTSYRILAYVNDDVVLFPMDNDNTIGLKKESATVLAAAEKSGAAKLLDDPYSALQNKTPTGKAGEKMKSNYALIKPVLDGGDEMLIDFRLRSRTLNNIGGGSVTHRRKVVRTLATYWKKGQTINSLQPEYGKNTKPRNCKRKPGRRLSDSAANPPPVNDELRQLFRRVIDRYMLKSEQRISLASAHARLVSEYIALHPGVPVSSAPTLYQFRYFYRTYKSFPEKLKAVTSENEYAKDKRSLHGTIYDIVNGIGQIYEIDATKPSVYLVSDLDRSQPVGQPTLYVVTDVYSRMIVGVHVAIEPAQFELAAASLVNAIANKNEFLAACSDGINPDAWDVSGLPANVTADNAELSGQQIEAFCRSNCVTIGNTKSYRGDQKSTVERSIGLVQGRTEPVIEARPSLVKLRKEGAKDLRCEATLTLSDYRKIVINAIVDLNNRVLEFAPPGYPAGRAPTPKAIWEWCHCVGGGKSYLRRAPKEDLLKRTLMPRFDATVSREGIRAEKITYTCERARELGWFERDRHAPRPQTPRIAIDPANVGKAWLFPSEDTQPQDAWPCTLAAKDKHFDERPLFEVRAYKNEQGNSAKRAEREHQLIQGKMHQKNEDIAKKAKASKPKTTESKKTQLEGLADNRRTERRFQALKSQGVSTQEAKNIKPIKPEKPANPYELPDDMDDLD